MAWTSPSTWVAAAVVTAAQLNTQLRDNFKAIGDPWTAYTPVWDSTGTAVSLGNGTLTGAYMQAGKLVTFKLTLTMGSTTGYGTGTYRWTLPVAANGGIRDPIAGAGTVYDNSANDCRTRPARLINATKVMLTNSDGTDVALGVPFTWATNDTIQITGTYEAA